MFYVGYYTAMNFSQLVHLNNDILRTLWVNTMISPSSSVQSSPHILKRWPLNLFANIFFGQKCILDKRKHVPMSDLGSCRVEHKP